MFSFSHFWPLFASLTSASFRANVLSGGFLTTFRGLHTAALFSLADRRVPVRGSATGARRGTFRRTCALRRPGGSVASTKRHSRSVSGPHAPLPRARLVSLSLSLPFPRRERSIPLCTESFRINRANFPREQNRQGGSLVEFDEIPTIDRSPCGENCDSFSRLR